MPPHHHTTRPTIEHSGVLSAQWGYWVGTDRASLEITPPGPLARIMHGPPTPTPTPTPRRTTPARYVAPWYAMAGQVSGGRVEIGPCLLGTPRACACVGSTGRLGIDLTVALLCPAERGCAWGQQAGPAIACEACEGPCAWCANTPRPRVACVAAEG